MNMKSIFSLGVGNNLQETYLTRVFTFVLRNVSLYPKYLLGALFKEEIHEVDSIDAEVRTDSEQPDIVIGYSTSRGQKNELVIENKIGADFTPDQLIRYKKKYNRVFLVYKYLPEPNQVKVSDAAQAWYKVYSETKKLIENQSPFLNDVDDVEKYILEQFIYFLEENNMGIEKVEVDIKNGLKSLKNLYSEINASLEEIKKLNLKITQISRGEFYIDWSLGTNDKKIMRCCLYYFPLRFFTYYEPQTEEKNPIGKKIKEKYPDIVDDLGWREIWRIINDFPFDESFFGSPPEDQVSKIKKFIEESFNQLSSSRA